MLLEPHFGQLICISFLSDRRISIFSLMINHLALMQRRILDIDISTTYSELTAIIQVLLLGNYHILGNYHT